MNLTDAEMRALVRLGYSIALADLGREDKTGFLAKANGEFSDGIPMDRLNRILAHVPPEAIRQELEAAGLRVARGRLP